MSDGGVAGHRGTKGRSTVASLGAVADVDARSGNDDSQDPTPADEPR
jgi:hypothetical protein